MSLVGKKGIDIGDHNGNINLAAAKAAGYEFVMLKCGYGSDEKSQDDSRFEENVKKAESLGMPWGAWLYSYALNKTQALSEVEHVKRLLKGKKPTLPVVIDMEDGDNYKTKRGAYTAEVLTTVCKTFVDGIRAAGYYPMIYTGYYELRDYISASVVASCDIWLAEWSRSPDYVKDNLGMWQYGGETNLLESPYITGISGKVDKNKCYKDYPTIIKKGGYNGWGDGTVTQANSLKFYTLAKSGYKNSAAQVKTVQRLLNWLGYKDKNGKVLKVNGSFDASTDYAVREYQRKHDLTVDGIVGEKTWKLLTAGK